MTLTKHNIVDKTLQQVIPKRAKIVNKHGRVQKPPGQPPSILSVETDTKKERWHYPTEVNALSKDQKTEVIAAVVGQMVKVVFNYHYYEFEGQIYHQESGGPTGLTPSGPCSQILLDWVIKEMRAIAEKSVIIHFINPVSFSKLEIHLVKKYVDDLFSCTSIMKKGTEWDNNQKALVWSPTEESDQSTDEQTMFKEYAAMASNILSCLTLTWVTPC